MRIPVTYLFSGLHRPDGSMCSECLSVVTCYYVHPEYVPRTSARAHTCAVGADGPPACPEAENTRNNTLPEEKKC